MTTKKGCGSCGSAKIQNVSIAFKDETAPKIKRITITSDKNSDTPALYFKEGQTIYVKVKFSEYVRLADNNAGSTQSKTSDWRCRLDRKIRQMWQLRMRIWIL